MSAAYKRALIDFLLAHGQVEHYYRTTREALEGLALRGVDYDRSPEPDFAHVAVQAGDSFTDATYAEAFAGTVYPMDSNPNDYTDRYEFFIPAGTMQRMMFSFVLRSILQATDEGDAGWKARLTSGGHDARPVREV